jgi:hypothetical protein
MWIDIDGAVQIYARFCRARFGSMATTRVLEKAKQLKRDGDLEGARVWEQVAQELDRLDSAPLQPVLAVRESKKIN